MRLRTLLSLLTTAGVLLLVPACEKPQQEDSQQEKIVIPEAVDLGLSVKWASFDVGATKPGEIGYYVSWGETEPKSLYKWTTYTWCTGNQSRLTKYNYNAEFGSQPDYRIYLQQEDDIARVLYGGDWHVPTATEIRELIDATFLTKAVVRVGTVDCLQLTSTRTGQSILLPAGGVCDGGMPQGVNNMGYFWSAEIDRPKYVSTLDVHHPYDATFLAASPKVADHFTSLSLTTGRRAFGMNIRAVKGEEHL